MLELKRPLNGLKKNIYTFQDVSENANNTFKVTDLPDKFLLGKNSFKLHLKEDILVLRSQVYIDIIDSFGNPIYYTIISDNLPNKERIIAVYIYDSTPVGECELIIAGRLDTNPNTGLKIPYSNDQSSPDYHGIPNVVWRKVVQINPQEVESPVYFSIPPTVTYSEIRKPQYQSNTDNRLVSLYSTASSTATMYSNRGQMNVVDDVDRRSGDTPGHVLSDGTSSATFVPINPIGDSNEVASLYFSRFDITASMEGGRVYFNNIPYSYPPNAVVTESKVLNYSGSIVKVVDKNTCFVTPPFYQILNYTDNTGTARKLVLDGFREVRTFTASYHMEPQLTVSTASYNSYIKLEISNAEPDIGSVKAVKVKAKSINKPGQFVDLGTYDVKRKNILLAGSSSYTMTSRGIEPLSVGDFRKLGNPLNYWTGSSNVGAGVNFINEDSIMDGVIFPDRSILDTIYDYYDMYLLPQYMVPVKKDTEYELTFDMLYLDAEGIPFPRQLDVFISGSEIESVSANQIAVHAPLKKALFGTHVGSVDAQKTLRHRPKFYFTAKKTGYITPRLVNRITGAVYANMEISVRNEPGYSSKFIDLEVPLPIEFSSKSEISIDLDYYNAKNERANTGTSLYGVVFDGNTSIIPVGTVSSSAQIGPTGIYSGSGTASMGTEVFITDDGDSVYKILLNSPSNYQSVYQDNFPMLGFEKINPFNTSSCSVGISDEDNYTETRATVVSNGIITSSVITVSPYSIYLQKENCYIALNDQTSSILIGNSSYFSFIDAKAKKSGLQYHDDYSNDIMSSSRSMTDVRTVRKMFSSASLVSSSAQINTGSFSGSFFGSGRYVTDVISSSYSVNSDHAVSASYVSGEYGFATATTDSDGVIDQNHSLGVRPVSVSFIAYERPYLISVKSVDSSKVSIIVYDVSNYGIALNTISVDYYYMIKV